MANWLYREWRMLTLVIAVILATGAATFLTIGRQEDPTITNLFATVVTPYPGADPERVEALVTEKIEEELREIAEIDEITSTSRTGISVVRVELSNRITDQQIEQAWSEIRDALSDAARNLPEGVPDPEFDNDRTGAFTAISAIGAAPGRSATPALLKRYAEVLQDRLRQLSATKNVRLYGAQTEEILVEVDPRRLASLGLTPDDVSRAVAQADAKVRAGQLRGARQDLLIEVAGEIDSLRRVRDIPISTAVDGQTVRVADIAEVRRTIRTPAETHALLNGRPVVLVAARMENDLQVDTWMKNVRNVVAGFEEELPAGLEHKLLFDQSEYTADRLGDVGINLLIGIALVVSVLFLTLGWRSALIVALMLPMTSLVSLAILQRLGVPIHQMSVTGLIVALGLLVDAAIVMTDDIRRRLIEGAAREEAIRHGVKRLTVPLLASTVTTVLAFMPMILLPGPAGDFVGSIATAVVVMLTVSFLLAITVTPALAGRMLRQEDDGRRPSWWNAGIRSGGLGRVFSWSLDLSLRYRRLAVLGALILPVIGFGAFPTLTAQFFPGVDRDQFYVQVKLNGGASIAEARAQALIADGVLKRDDRIQSVAWVVGESAPAFYYNITQDRDGTPSFAEALVTTESEDSTPEIIDGLQASLDRVLPGAQVIVRGLVQGPPVAAPVEVRIIGPDVGTLRRIGDDVRSVLAEVPDVIHSRTTLEGGNPKLFFDLDEDRVRRAGLDLGSVARQLEATLEGATGGSLIEATEELPVRVRVGGEARGTVEAVRATDVLPSLSLSNAVSLGATSDGIEDAYPGIPLSTLGTLRLVPAQTPIERLEGERVNTVQGFVTNGVLPEEVLKVFRERLDASGITLPPGYRFETGGDSDARSETITNLMSSVGLIVILTIATIVMTFNSFRLSMITGAVAVLSMGLSLLALALFQYPFGVQALIGVIGSIGVSINAAIIILTALKSDPAAMAGDRTRMRDIVMEASRHIVSTTTTTFGGFLPLILAGGGFWPPFAMAIAGGVLLSTVVSFYFTPPMFALVIGKGRRRAEEATPDNVTPLAAAAE